MSIRVSGITSGLDTDSMVKELVSAYSTKKEKYEKQLQKQEWIMDTWSNVNTKVYSFYTGTLSSLRYSKGYNVRTSTVSNSSVATVTASSDAVTSTQSLSVKELATSGYLTGGKLTDENGKTYSGDTKLSDLGLSDGTIMIGDNKISYTADTTLTSLATQIKSQGVSANYDAATGRMFIASSSSGADNEFTVTAGDSAGFEALKKLGLMSITDTEGEETADVARYRKLAADGYDGSSDVNSQYESSKWTVESYTANLTSAVKTATSNKESLEKSQQELQEKYDKITASDYDWSTDYSTEDEYTKAKEDLSKQIEDNTTQIAEYESTISEKQALLDDPDALSAKVDELNADILSNLQSASDSEIAIAKEIVAQIDAGTLTNSSESARITAKDAHITLNGANYTSSTNSFSINGLNITATAKTTSTSVDADGNEVETDNPVSISTSVDTQGIYDKIKSLFSQYNEVMTYLDTLYYADSASGYEPLTDDEKDAMTDTQIEEWEKKIKDSLLRKDSTIGSITSAMKTSILGAQTTHNGKTYTIASFGIATQSYFSASEETRDNFHIDGDTDDSLTSGNTDKLMAAINADPEGVVEFFQNLAQNLYKTLGNKMSSSSLSSAFTIYNDKEMSSQYSDYQDKVDEWEDKISDYEDYYYSKFSSMESAMTKLNSQQSQLSSLLGG